MGAWTGWSPQGCDIVGTALSSTISSTWLRGASCKVRFVGTGILTASVDYNETFSPMAKLSVICLITALAGHKQLGLEQYGCWWVYLNAPLMETIYMRQPRGYEAPGKENAVCQLIHALYAWNGRNGVVPPPLQCHVELRFHSLSNRTCSLLSLQGRRCTIVVVDVTMMAGNSRKCRTTFKQQLGRKFKIKDWWVAWLLGIEVKRDMLPALFHSHCVCTLTNAWEIRLHDARLYIHNIRDLADKLWLFLGHTVTSITSVIPGTYVSHRTWCTPVMLSTFMSHRLCLLDQGSSHPRPISVYSLSSPLFCPTLPSCVSIHVTLHSCVSLLHSNTPDLMLCSIFQYIRPCLCMYLTCSISTWFLSSCLLDPLCDSKTLIPLPP